jgi:2-(1,2-epoxy-1,2-dihydrophenyl)acetyl-CoA isomerase
MKTQERLSADNEHFSSVLENGILVIRQKQHILHLTHDNPEDIFLVYEYMDSLLSNESYKALVMFVRSLQISQIEYRNFLSKILSDKKWESLELERFVNVVNTLFLRLATLNRMTVFAGQGTLSLFYLNVGLAHDYRIVAEDTVFENLNADTGLITKGSGYFLPRLLGIRKATEVLQWKSFSAEDALQLGLVDRIVPVSKLEEETMQFVLKDPVRSSSTLLGIRKLLKCDIKDLKRSLDSEDCLIKECRKSAGFGERALRILKC